MNTGRIPLPESTVKLIADVADLGERHPGLQLDKYCPNWVHPGEDRKFGEFQKVAIRETCQSGKSGAHRDVFQEASKRYTGLLQSLIECRGGKRWTARTIAPLTLHLSRATAMENTGICLHPVHGFVYLPGTGLKGMARAWAETVWLSGQTDRDAAREKIKQVFGRSKGPNESTDECGAVVFHDAWPVEKPELFEDTLTCHHTKYYQDEKPPPPADWEQPNMVGFLAIRSPAEFDFTLTLRRKDIDPELLEFAEEWLQGALLDLGAGAKTNAGYGAFAWPEGRNSAPGDFLNVSRPHLIQQVTPAFIAGSDQYSEKSCELRPASLRGMLRWWWRTMHAGHVSVETLRAMENTVWGNTDSAGAVRLILEPIKEQNTPSIEPIEFDRDRIIHDHNLSQLKRRKAIQGLHYGTFGMDDKEDERRYYLPPGGQWQVRLIARRGFYPITKEKPNILPDIILDQAETALTLLCHFGGIGSKSRKGFGSYRLVSDQSQPEKILNDAVSAGEEFRRTLEISEHPSTDLPQSCSLSHHVGVQCHKTKWCDYWVALDQVNDVVQAFAKEPHIKKDNRKYGLGLPRDPSKNAEKEIDLYGYGKVTRYASPIHFHMHAMREGTVEIRCIAFPSPHLDCFGNNQDLLIKFMDFFGKEITKRINQNSGKGLDAPVIHARRQTADGLKEDEIVPAVLTEQNKKGTWKARHEASGQEASILNSSKIPPDFGQGKQVNVRIAHLRLGQIDQFTFVGGDKPKGQNDGENKGKGKGGKKGGRR